MYSLLSPGVYNSKISKNIKKGYLAFSLNLAHSNLSGFNVCPKAEKLINDGSNFQDPNKNYAKCSLDCVGGGGLASVYNTVLESRIKKTIAFFKDREYFLNTLVYEVEKAINQANNKNLIPVFRLNAYSDLLWERFKIKDNKNIFELFPDVDFYDYSKLLHRKPPANYQITYSHYGNWKETETALKTGLNVAIVFDSLPLTIKINNNIYNVINGDKTDLRLNEKIDNKPVIVGLKFKAGKNKLERLQAGIKSRFIVPNNQRGIIC
tara:strand:+ start:1804 stop:2598 length:795 start_codon:yes stop_codon:yes gene_type:complete